MSSQGLSDSFIGKQIPEQKLPQLTKGLSTKKGLGSSQLKETGLSIMRNNTKVGSTMGATAADNAPTYTYSFASDQEIDYML